MYFTIVHEFVSRSDLPRALSNYQEFAAHELRTHGSTSGTVVVSFDEPAQIVLFAEWETLDAHDQAWERIAGTGPGGRITPPVPLATPDIALQYSFYEAGFSSREADNAIWARAEVRRDQVNDFHAWAREIRKRLISSTAVRSFRVLVSRERITDYWIAVEASGSADNSRLPGWISSSLGTAWTGFERVRRGLVVYRWGTLEGGQRRKPLGPDFPGLDH